MSRWSSLLVALALSYHANAADPADSSPMQRALQALPKEIAVSAGGDFRNATIADVQADHVCLMLGPDPALEKVMREAKIERESQPFKRCYPFSSIVWWNSSTEGRPAFRLAGL